MQGYAAGMGAIHTVRFVMLAQSESGAFAAGVSRVFFETLFAKC